MSRYRVALLTAVVLCVAAVGHAQPAESPDPPLVNWPAPAFWTPPTPRAGAHGSTAAGKRGSVSTQADPSNSLPFIPVTPCRLIDTKHGPIDIPASSHRGIFTNGETRTYQFSLSSTCTGLPTDVGAWSLVFQYTTMSVSGGPASYLTAWPAGGTMPSPESTLFGYNDRWTANSAIIPGGSPFGSVSVYAQHGGDVIIDVNGYYASLLPYSGSASSAALTDLFSIENTGAGRAMHAIAASGTALLAESTSGTGVEGSSASGFGVTGTAGGIPIGLAILGPVAVAGFSSSGFGVAGISDSADGVWGYNRNTGVGVKGESPSGTGVEGSSTSGFGVIGIAGGTPGLALLGPIAVAGSSASGDGVAGISDSAYGVYGYSGNAGVMGESYGGTGVHGKSTSFDGVRGESSASSKSGVYGFNSDSGGFGVFGRNTSTSSVGYLGGTYGVSGTTNSSSNDSAGVYGQTATTSGATGFLPAGVRGDTDTGIGVHGISQNIGVSGRLVDTSGNLLADGQLGRVVGGNNYAVYAWGDIGGTGAKGFIEPHPLRADQTIRYIALEGPEAGTYFRGRGSFVGHSAVIEVPEDFRLVTDPDGLSVQVTPIGEFASVAVVSIGLDEITLKATRDVEFFFTVNGVRHTHKDLKPILEESAFMPEGPNATIPGYLNAAQKQSLIANGTYNADGTVNMQTAERVGWTKVWRDREEAIKASAEKAAAQHAAQSGGQGQPGQRP